MKRRGVVTGGQQTSRWTTPGVREAIREEKSFKMWLHFNTGDRYTKARRTVKFAGKAVKDQAWKEFGEKLESDNRSAKYSGQPFAVS